MSQIKSTNTKTNIKTNTSTMTTKSFKSILTKGLKEEPIQQKILNIKTNNVVDDYIDDNDEYTFSKYKCDLDNIKEKLNLYGVAIVPNVLDNKECENMKVGMWDYLETITSNLNKPINRNDIKSWKTFKELYPKHSMLLQQWSIGHAQFIWNVRTNPKVIEPFEKIWNTNSNDLLVSFDGASFHFPPEQTGYGWKKPNKSWLHSDQSYKRNDFECVQGWINAYDTKIGDATLTFLEGSHNYHAEFSHKFNCVENDDWYVLNQEELDWYKNTKKCNQKSIMCPAGSLVLWDSRTIHCGTEPLETRAEPNFRCVVYLCYTPRNFATETSLKKKIKAWNELRTTSHWPHNPKLFPLYPRTWGKPLPNIVQIPKPIINNIGYRLIGYEEEEEEEPPQNV